eukprot:6774426-Karenia_brevis.AAC.1
MELAPSFDGRQGLSFGWLEMLEWVVATGCGLHDAPQWFEVGNGWFQQSAAHERPLGHFSLTQELLRPHH